MKKYLSVLLALGIVLCTCACGKQTTGGDEVITTPTSEATTTLAEAGQTTASSLWDDEEETPAADPAGGSTATTEKDTNGISQSQMTTTAGKVTTTTSSKTPVLTGRVTTTTKKTTSNTKKPVVSSTKTTSTEKKTTTTAGKATAGKKTTTTTKKVTPTTKHVHNFAAATCNDAATCSCGATLGSELGHDWQENCGVSRICKRCGAKRKPSSKQHVLDSSGRCTLCGQQISKPTTRPTLNPTPEPGDYVFFGLYEQDNKIDNGKEPIEWQVLKVKDGKALLISRYGLDCQPYNERWTNVTWETCTLRRWLNAEFLNTAFSAEEQKNIPTVTVSADKNPVYNTDPGKATKDQVFLLSIAEAERYFASYSARKCTPTAYAVAQGAYKGYNDNCWWWLRSPGYDQTYAAYVNDYGDVDELGYGVYRDFSAVRPALWVNLNS